MSLHCFSEATEEVSLDSPEKDYLNSPEPTPAITPVSPTPIAPRAELKMSHPKMFEVSKEEV